MEIEEIAKRERRPGGFLDGIRDMVREIVQTYSHISEEGQKLFAPEKEVIRPVPCTGRSMRGKKNFSCGSVPNVWTSPRADKEKRTLKKGRTSVKGILVGKGIGDPAALFKKEGWWQWQIRRSLILFPPGGEKPDMSQDDLARLLAALSPEDQA